MRLLLKPNSLAHAIVVSTLAYAFLCLTSSVSAEPLSGEQLYRKLCAECHGAKGEGVKDEYKEPLIGDWSLGRLQ